VDAGLNQPKSPALCKVTIFEIAERPWGWLSTSAEVDDRVYVGSREWRQQQRNARSPNSIGPITGNQDPYRRHTNEPTTGRRPAGRPMGVCTGPDFRKKKNPAEKK